MSPQTCPCRYTHTHLKRFMRTLVFSTFPLQDFSFFFFLFFFLRVHQKHNNANKRISYFFLLRYFLSAFFIFVRLFACCNFSWLRFCAFWCFCSFGAFQCFLVLFVRVKSFRKKRKKSKTALITSFILLLTFGNHYIFYLSTA